MRWFIAACGAGRRRTLIGALVYAELAAAYPSTGGEYHFLTRAYGQGVGFLFAWARTTVIQTGAIAAICFVLGDYAQQIWSLGTYGSAIYGAAGLFILTLVNLAGTYREQDRAECPDRSGGERAAPRSRWSASSMAAA